MIKDRIIKYLEYRGISKHEFTKKCNLVHTFFNKGEGFNVLLINNILKSYPDINIEWLFTGKGEMIKKNTEKDEYIREIQEKVKLYEDMISLLKKNNEFLEKELEECRRNQKNSSHVPAPPSKLKK